MLSGYRIMWMTVMFDLPVREDYERKAANGFRLYLKDLGFEKVQLSVYSRHCGSQRILETYCKMVEDAIPEGGLVNILQFTDKQYERIITYQGKSLQDGQKPPEQYSLF